ncbi:hypothetical protein ACIQWZ_09515 [Streptomyces sp. NPDC098077]|uniref:hypothetical protein n=1 Tax=Streptomyces sp. NPDC098077 TaxID=3366093 RepID=UPI00382E23E5
MRCELALASTSWVLVDFLGRAEIAAGAGHPVLALFEERVGAQPVAEIVVLPWFAGGCGPGGDRVAVDQDLDRADVPLEVLGGLR